ncbi:MAG: SAM-dependent chlorinase/fluorinase [Anaerolineae bacterium]
MTIITLTTDFGLADGYVAAMKGVILDIAPTATLVDVSHEIAPQQVRAAAYVLQTALPHFPAGSIHVAVVDPGVGSERRPLAARVDGSFVVGPDNGVFSALFAAARQPVACVHLTEPRFWRSVVSQTFHGRDIFAPVAAHLANGVPLDALGPALHDPVQLSTSAARRLPDDSIHGEIIHIDRFGNLISNIPGAWLAGRLWHVLVAGQQVPGPSLHYAQAAPQQLLTLVSSSNWLEVAVREGNAAERLGVNVGEPVIARLLHR